MSTHVDPIDSDFDQLYDPDPNPVPDLNCDLPFVPTVMLLIELHDGRICLATDKPEFGAAPVIAQEGNESELRKIGDQLLERKVIVGYQLVKTTCAPIRTTVNNNPT